jgi:peptidoglycan hydrolase CwlO-like protein
MSLREREASQIAEMRSELELCQQECVELQQHVELLQQQADSAVKNLESSNKALVCELEEKLHREKQECHKLREQLVVSGIDVTVQVINVSCCLILRNHRVK